MRSNMKLFILISTNMPPPSSLEIEFLSNHQQPAAPSSHSLPLILWEKAHPNLYPMHNSTDNLQKNVPFFLLKTISCMHVYMAQHIAETPICILCLSLFSTPFNQLLNILVILVEGD